MTTTTAYAAIVKHERNAAGDLVVVGKATGPDLDLDRQICDPAWLAKAMPEWMSSGGNIREQHSSIAAGVATELAQDGDLVLLGQSCEQELHLIHATHRPTWRCRVWSTPLPLRSRPHRP